MWYGNNKHRRKLVFDNEVTIKLIYLFRGYEWNHNESGRIVYS